MATEVPKIPTRYGLFSDNIDDGVVGSPFGPEPGYAEEMYANNPLFNQLGPGQGQSPMMIPPTQMTMGMFPQGPQMPMQGGQGMPQQGGPMQQGMPPQGMPPQGPPMQGGGMPPQGQMPQQQMPPPQGGPMGIPQPGDTSSQGPYSGGPISRLGQWLKAQNPQDLAMSGAGFIQGITNPEVPFQVAQQMRQERMQQEQIMQQQQYKQQKDQETKDWREQSKFLTEDRMLDEQLKEVNALDDWYRENPEGTGGLEGLERKKKFAGDAVRKDTARKETNVTVYQYLRRGVAASSFEAALKVFDSMDEKLKPEWAEEWGAKDKLRDVHEYLVKKNEMDAKIKKDRLRQNKTRVSDDKKLQMSQLKQAYDKAFSQYSKVRQTLARPEYRELDIWSEEVRRLAAEETDWYDQMEYFQQQMDELTGAKVSRESQAGKPTASPTDKPVDDTAEKVQANRDKINKLYESFNE